MKRYIHISLIFFCVSFLSCTTLKSPNKEIISTWEGSYQANYYSDGIIKNWTFYSDGTMTGDWITDNGSVPLTVDGTYEINNNQILFVFVLRPL